ncbi:MAG TPA: XRE family transcriptional regulator [Trinickia sp.]|jgi:HTH-type transcriptional regulator/antitoxin HipB|uniref:XRE family transcriptional regulator n=1 Tax=Trinickia sp. TaxID=2571163 RepID=UPI002F40EFB7
MEIIIRTPAQLGQVLLSARKTQGITQTHAAAQIGVQQPRLSALETTSTGSLSLQQMLMLFALYRLELCVQTRDRDEPDHAQPEW